MIKDNAKQIIEQYDKTNSRWVFANKVLYDLCENHIEHNDEHIIVAKIWLIGRSYAAAIERRKNAKYNDSKDFYYDVVAPKICQKGEELDKRIRTINGYGADSPNGLDDKKIKYIIETHAFLTKLFNSITEMDNRSLASKYLHFHCPNYFFIYDSRAGGNVGAFVSWNKEFKELYCRIYKDGYDEIYCKFYLKALQISKYAKDLKPRDVDNILYY